MLELVVYFLPLTSWVPCRSVPQLPSEILITDNRSDISIHLLLSETRKELGPQVPVKGA